MRRLPCGLAVARPGLYALRADAIALLGWAGVRLEAAADTAPEPQRWRAATQALGHWVLPEFDMRCAIIDQRLPVAAP